MARKFTTEDFITKAKEIHGEKYDYSKVEYINSETKVCIICPKHGEFFVKANNHINCKNGCPFCAKENSSKSQRKTTEDFIREAREVHGNKYDYSKVVYKNATTNVTIICPEHGEFEQKPYVHIGQKSGCPRCSRPNTKLNTNEFITKALEVHGNKYNYSKVVYKNYKTKVLIICPEHGEFEQIPNVHLSGSGCPRCYSENRYLIKEQFITKSREVHGNKYDYSKVEYKNFNTKVTIICPIHGEFQQRPNDHLNGKYGCPKCGLKKIGDTKRSNITEFIKRSREVHGDKYKYSKVEYVNSATNVTIICPEHGEFEQTPMSHLLGSGCPKCVGKNKTTEDFIREAREVHGNKYDYSKVEYVNSQTKVCIICPEHGEFWQRPNSHLRGRGCNKCHCPNAINDTNEFITKAREVHGDKYDYSKVVYQGVDTKITIICHEHGEFEQKPYDHIKLKRGCPNCVGLTKKYKFNLLEEFVDEYYLRDFLMTNDENLIYIILRNIEKIDPKFNPIVKDIDRVLRSDSTNPIEDLEDKYRTPNETVTPDETVTSDTVDGEINTTTIDDIDLDDDDAVEAFINKTNIKVEKKEPTIDELTKARENEINLINTIEHMLTPEDLKFIKDKFLNDKRRNWMLERDKR